MLLEGEVDWTLTFAVLAAIGFGLALFAAILAVRNRRGGHGAHYLLEDPRRSVAADDKRLSEILDAIPVALLQTDLEGRFVFANRAAHQLLGGGGAGLVGLRFPAAVWGISFPNGRPIPPDLLPSARALRGQTVKGFQHLIANPSTGRRMLVSVTAMPIFDDQGRIIGSTAAVVETASLTRPETRSGTQMGTSIAGQAFDPAPDEDQDPRRYEAIGRMSSGLAQDFGAVLAVMNNALELLSSKPDDADRVRRLTQAVLGAGRRGDNLARRMAALTAGRAPLPDHLLDAGGLLRALEGRLRQAAGASADLMLVLPETPPSVRLDPVALEGVATALVRNAAEAGARIISLRLSQEDEGATLTVSDDGTGMDGDTLKRACEPFFTTRPRSAGLGLTQVAAFARAHGGELILNSVVGEGAEVILRLPRAST